MILFRTSFVSLRGDNIPDKLVFRVAGEFRVEVSIECKSVTCFIRWLLLRCLRSTASIATAAESTRSYCHVSERPVLVSSTTRDMHDARGVQVGMIESSLTFAFYAIAILVHGVNGRELRNWHG
jgi:hypothetical protein